MLSCLLITELSMSTIWSVVYFHFLETTFLLRCSAFFLLAANMRCNVVSMLDTKYPSYPHTRPSISTFSARPIRVRASSPSIITNVQSTKTHDRSTLLVSVQPDRHPPWVVVVLVSLAPALVRRYPALRSSEVRVRGWRRRRRVPVGQAMGR